MSDNKRKDFEDKALNDPDFSDIKGKNAKNFKFQLYALKICRGNVTKAALMLGLSRRIFYKNCELHPAYKAAFEDIKLVVNDMVDDALLENALSGDTGAIVWFDKTRGAYKHLAVTKIDHTTNGDKIDATPQLIFMSADNMTPEEIQKYKEQYLHQPHADTDH